MRVPAPIELRQIGLNPEKFFYSDKKSFRGPCPECGGNRRFVIFTDNPWPLFHGYCDECPCKIKAWERVHTRVDPIELQKLKAAQEAEERAKAEYRRKKLAEFTTRELWEELAQRMTSQHIEWWESQGIPEDLQHYLRIGYLAEKKFWHGTPDGKVMHSSPAYTIPWFDLGFEFKTMQYRLISPPDPADRYRFEDGLGGGGEHFYMVNPDEPIRDKVIICEGAKKAIVTWQWLAPASQRFTILAAPSANTLRPALEATRECGLRYIILDPGAEIWASRAKTTNPKTTHIVRLPAKIDDMYLYYGLDRYAFENILTNAL